MYKQITHDSNSTPNGIYQIEILNLNINQNFSPNYFYINNFKKYKNLLNSLYKNLEAKLIKEAKLTDINTFSPFIPISRYIVSQKVVNIFKDSKIPTDIYHFIEIKIKNTSEKFYILFIAVIPNIDINLSKSKIFKDMDFLNKDKKEIKFSNHKLYNNRNDELLFIYFENVCIDKKYKSYGIIYIQGISDYFLHINVLKLFKENKITGYRIPKRQTKLFFCI